VPCFTTDSRKQHLCSTNDDAPAQYFFHHDNPVVMAEVLASARRMYCNSDITSDPTACLEDFIPIAKVGSALCAVLCSCDARAIVGCAHMHYVFAASRCFHGASIEGVDIV
jgi:hypothetical protein